VGDGRAQRLGKSTLLALAFLSIVTYAAHFLYSGTFGLYEADLQGILSCLERGVSDLGGQLGTITAPLSRGSLGHEGRFLGAFLESVLAILGASIAGLRGFYIVSFLVNAINACLFYIIFYKKDLRGVGFVGALIFLLFPAYALHQFLNAAFWLSPAMTLFLLATLCYLSKRRLVVLASYPLIAATLVVYETPFLPFFVVPLLKHDAWDLKLVRKTVVHAFVLILIMAVVFAMRTSEGEGRVAEFIASSPVELIGTVFLLMIRGAYAALVYSFYHAVVQTVQNIDAGILATIVAFSVVLGAIFSIALKTATARPRLGQWSGPWRGDRLFKTFLTGLAMTLLSYPLAFYNMQSFLRDPSMGMGGMASRIHMAASFGAAVSLASLALLVVQRMKGRTVRTAAAWAAAVFIALIIGYGHVVQYTYVDGWRYQQWFWTSIMEQAPDIEDGTLILVETEDLPDTANLSAYTWYGTPYMLAYIYKYPAEWKEHPRLNVKGHNWYLSDLRPGNNGLEIFIERPHHAITQPPRWEAAPNGNVILFRALGSELLRVSGVIAAGSGELRLKERPGAAVAPGERPKGVLYEHVIKHGVDFNMPRPERTFRRLSREPALENVRTFDGASHIEHPNFDRADIRKYTIEMWLRPDPSASTGLFTKIGPYSDTYPPMPAIVGPLRIDQNKTDSILVSLIGDREKGYAYLVKNMPVSGEGSEWVHVELGVDNDAGVSTLFLNGEPVTKFDGAEIPLRGAFSIGKGYKARYWSGDMADLRISSVVRHTKRFEPENGVSKVDEQTLYVMERRL
jgi:hypothetical protein